jgi:tetratricopeptide (TPR) repeat protein
MTTTTLSMLDQSELLQLSLEASKTGEAGAAIAYLKEAVSRADATGVAHFLLGAEYAQIKLYDRAVNEMEAALALDPALSIARLQLGLLWLTSGVADRATQVFEPLAELPASDALRHFGGGLIALIKDQFDEATRQLQAGIALNLSNDALNIDMQRMVDEIARLQASGQVGALEAAPEQPAADEETHHVLLSAYTGNTSH